MITTKGPIKHRGVLHRARPCLGRGYQGIVKIRLKVSGETIILITTCIRKGKNKQGFVIEAQFDF